VNIAMQMPLHPTWQDIAPRLLMTVVAGALIGLDRESRGHAAGFRTTILVGLAACVAMVEANLLLSLSGKAADSFGAADVLRLPLGILTGVGFIGGGAILKRGRLVVGVTTAATLWMVTVIGLCFGAGLWPLGIAATAIAVLALGGLKWFDRRIPREQRAMLTIEAKASEMDWPDLDGLVRTHGYRAKFVSRHVAEDGGIRSRFEITWKQKEIEGKPPSALLALLSSRYFVRSLEVVEL